MKLLLSAVVSLALLGITSSSRNRHRFRRQSQSDLDPALLEEVFGTPNNPNNKEFGNPSNNNPEYVDPNIMKVTRPPPRGPPLPPLDGPDSPPVPGGCVCVPYYQCENNSVNIDGVGLIDIRLGGSVPHPQQCANYLEICCQLPPSGEFPPPGPPNPPTQQRLGCGLRNREGVGFRITGDMDSEAQFGEFPWMGAVLRKEQVDADTVLNVYQCGTSLIHPRVALTAAHCVVGKNPEELKTRFGEWDTQTQNELYRHQDRDVVQVIVHEEYYGGALFNDVALLILDSDLELAPNVDTICLPPKGAIFDQSTCTASGWGKDVFGKEGRYQVILKKIDLPVVPFKACQNALRKTRLGPYFRLHTSFMCAGGEPGKDTCKGDGGSPLVCPIRGSTNQYVQAGIVAWGIGCGEHGTPGVYADVSKFRDWIDWNLRKLNLDTSFYNA